MVWKLSGSREDSQVERTSLTNSSDVIEDGGSDSDGIPPESMVAAPASEYAEHASETSPGNRRKRAIVLAVAGFLAAAVAAFAILGQGDPLAPVENAVVSLLGDAGQGTGGEPASPSSASAPSPVAHVAATPVSQQSGGTTQAPTPGASPLAVKEQAQGQLTLPSATGLEDHGRAALPQQAAQAEPAPADKAPTAPDHSQKSPSQPDQVTLPPADNSVAVAVGVVGPASSQKVVEALAQIEDWRTAGNCNKPVLLQYLAHSKVWVRLAALEVAAQSKLLTETEFLSAAKEISSKYESSQIRRFLQRVKHHDRALWGQMVRALGV